MTTDQRLERLERQNRWMKVAVASMAVVLAVVFLIAAGQDQEKVKVLEEVKAKKFADAAFRNKIGDKEEWEILDGRWQKETQLGGGE